MAFQFSDLGQHVTESACGQPKERLSLELEAAIENNRREIPRAKFKEPAIDAGAADI